MNMEKVQAFLNALHNDPRLKELAKGIRKPENDRETAEAYLELAKKWVTKSPGRRWRKA